MKKLLAVFAFLSLNAFAIDLSDLTAPMPWVGTLSNTDKVESRTIKIEQKIEQRKAELISEKKQEEIVAQEINTVNSNYADLSLKRLANDISYELDEDSAKINSDLAVLWNATLNRSETMKYAIYKLSNPDEDKPNESTMKKILKPIANFSSIAGASVAGNPFAATGALIGGGLANAFMKDDKELNYRFSKV